MTCLRSRDQPGDLVLQGAFRRIREAAGVQLDHLGPAPGCCFDLVKIRIDEKGNTDAVGLKGRHAGLHILKPTRHVETTLGGHLLTCLRNQAGKVRPDFQGQLRHLRRNPHFEIQGQAAVLADLQGIPVLHVTPVGAHMDRDRVRSAKAGIMRCIERRWLGIRRIRQQRVARLPQCRNVVDIDAQKHAPAITPHARGRT